MLNSKYGSPLLNLYNKASKYLLLARRAVEVYSTKELVKRSVQRVIPSSWNLEISKNDFAQQRERIFAEYGPKSSGSRNRVILVTSNGAGLGHLTRVSAVASRMKSETLIYTMSSAYSKIGWNKSQIVYFPSSGDLGMSSRAWNAFMAAHFMSVLETFLPDEVIFDGTFVYRGVVESTQRLGIPLTWLQRGCWKTEVDKSSFQRHHPETICERVIIPADFGSQEHLEFVKSMQVEHVNPITLVSAGEELDRQSACSALGLSAEKKNFLIQVGAGAINNTSSIRRLASKAVEELGDDWQAVLVRNPLSNERFSNNQSFVQAFPLALYFKAFEAGLFAAGYNSVQESVQMGLPSVFIPNLKTKTDDQLRRARGIESKSLGLMAETENELVEAIRALSKESVREMIRSKMLASRLPNGAQAVAEILDRPSNGKIVS